MGQIRPNLLKPKNFQVILVLVIQIWGLNFSFKTNNIGWILVKFASLELPRIIKGTWASKIE